MPTVGVFAAIFDERGRILCVRTNYALKGWTTPGGRVESGESPLDALTREVREEVSFVEVYGDIEVESGPGVNLFGENFFS